MSDSRPKSKVATAGLPETAPYVDEALRKSGIDPDRLSISKLGTIYRFPAAPPWLVRLAIGFALCGAQFLVVSTFPAIPPLLIALLQLTGGLVVLMAACEILVTATERLAARLHWNHYHVE